MKYFTLKYLKFHENFEIFQDHFFEKFHETSILSDLKLLKT